MSLLVWQQTGRATGQIVYRRSTRSPRSPSAASRHPSPRAAFGDIHGLHILGFELPSGVGHPNQRQPAVDMAVAVAVPEGAGRRLPLAISMIEVSI